MKYRVETQDVTEIQDDYLVTSDPAIKFVFRFCLTTEHNQMRILSPYIVKFGKAQVHEALKPVAGRAYFEIPTYKMDDETPLYKLDYFPGTRLAVAVNALTIDKTCGELRELWEWSEL